MPRLFLFFLAITLHLSAAQSPDTIGRPAHEVDTTGRATRLKVEFADATDNIKIVQLPDGTLVYVLKRPGTGNDRVLTPDEFTRLYFSQQSGRGWLSVIFNITSPVGLAWIAVGLGGQLLFTGRMLLQWIASEKHKRSVIPVAFWWMSLIGATMLLAYFIWRRDVVGILGQATGWFIYIRNLVLIHHSRS